MVMHKNPRFLCPFGLLNGGKSHENY
nr:hypothetical protein [Vibrio sp. 04Ya108]